MMNFPTFRLLFMPYQFSIAPGAIFDVPDPALLKTFYARVMGGLNGIVPFDARLFFVAGEPPVHHERVSSHEIGHILGLHHQQNDAGRLIVSGTNGLALSEGEIAGASYGTSGILNRQR